MQARSELIIITSDFVDLVTVDWCNSGMTRPLGHVTSIGYAVSYEACEWVSGYWLWCFSCLATLASHPQFSKRSINSACVHGTSGRLTRIQYASNAKTAIDKHHTWRGKALADHVPTSITWLPQTTYCAQFHTLLSTDIERRQLPSFIALSAQSQSAVI